VYRNTEPLTKEEMMVTENDLSKAIVHAAFTIHNQLGPGLLESVYEEIMYFELSKKGLSIARQKPVPVIWDTLKMELGFRADLVVENKVIIELKSVEAIAPVHYKQLLTYLKLTRLKLGILINFNENLIKNGIVRIVNNL
jgi:GxxExxY protein